MSHEAMNWVMIDLKRAGGLDGLSLAERYFLLHLADYANKVTWRCYPSQKRLARELDINLKTVTNYLAKLEAVGLISRQSRFRPNGDRTTDIILLNPELAEKIACSEDDDDDQPRAKKASPSAKKHVAEPSEDNSKDRMKEDAGEVAVVPLTLAEKVISFYNDIAARQEWSACGVLNDQRAKAIPKRVKEAGGFDRWCEFMLTAETSDFLTGKTGGQGSWRPHFDFFLQAQSFTRLIEGFYHRDQRHERHPADPRGDARAASHDRRTSSMLAGAQLAADALRRDWSGGN